MLLSRLIPSRNVSYFLYRYFSSNQHPQVQPPLVPQQVQPPPKQHNTQPKRTRKTKKELQPTPVQPQLVQLNPILQAELASLSPLIRNLVKYNKDNKPIWPRGEEWLQAHLNALALVETLTPQIDLVLPTPSAAVLPLKSPFIKDLEAWDLDYDQFRTLQEDTKYPFLFNKVKALMETLPEPHTLIFVCELLDYLGFGSPCSTHLEYRCEVKETIHIGPLKCATIIDIFIRHTTRLPPLGFGFENKKLKRVSIAPQVGSQLLGMALERLPFEVDPNQPIVVYVVEVRGRFFSFWKAAFSHSVLRAIQEGKTPTITTPLYVNRPRQGYDASAGYDFAVKAERRVILNALKSLTFTFDYKM